MIPPGFEPGTHSLEGCCSIQLSYGTMETEKQSTDSVFRCKDTPFVINNKKIPGLLVCRPGIFMILKRNGLFHHDSFDDEVVVDVKSEHVDA